VSAGLAAARDVARAPVTAREEFYPLWQWRGSALTPTTWILGSHLGLLLPCLLRHELLKRKGRRRPWRADCTNTNNESACQCSQSPASPQRLLGPLLAARRAGDSATCDRATAERRGSARQRRRRKGMCAIKRDEYDRKHCGQGRYGDAERHRLPSLCLEW
jgi:hypothetical protein